MRRFFDFTVHQMLLGQINGDGRGGLDMWLERGEGGRKAYKVSVDKVEGKGQLG